MPLDEVCVLEGSLEGLCLFVVHDVSKVNSLLN